MTFTGTFKVIKDGETLSVPYECHTRGGWRSPTSTYIFVDGKRITPYGFEKLGYEFTLDALFQITYKPVLKHLVFESLLYGSAAVKFGWDSKSDPYLTPVTLTEEHGFEYKI